MLVYPGSFNPLHPTHVEIIRHAEGVFGEECTLDVGHSAYDKKEVDDDEYYKRTNKLTAMGFNVENSCAISFVDKAARFKGCDGPLSFIVGFDTFLRIINAKYYDNNEEVMNRALQKMFKQGVRFAVYPRIVDLQTLALCNWTWAKPEIWQNMFVDMSQVTPEYVATATNSTQIREEMRKAS